VRLWLRSAVTQLIGLVLIEAVVIEVMANWSVALAQNRPPVPSRNRKKPRINLTQTPNILSSPSLVLEKLSDAMPTEPPFQGYGNIFRHLCKPEEGEHNCYNNGCDRITVNVSGLQFITRRSVLEAHPETLLGELNLSKSLLGLLFDDKVSWSTGNIFIWCKVFDFRHSGLKLVRLNLWADNF